VFRCNAVVEIEKTKNRNGGLFMLAGLRFVEDGRLGWTANWVAPFDGTASRAKPSAKTARILSILPRHLAKGLPIVPPVLPSCSIGVGSMGVGLCQSCESFFCGAAFDYEGWSRR